MKSIMTRESFTTTPLRPKIPMKDTALRATPRIQWPRITPMNPKGMTAMMMNGFVYERRGMARSAKIRIRATAKPRYSASMDSSCCCCSPPNVYVRPG